MPTILPGNLLLSSYGPARRTSGPLRGVRANPRHLLATGRPEPEPQPQPRITDGGDFNPSEVNEMVSSFKSRSTRTRTSNTDTRF